ncbi:class I SAM-dependent methyltransferase [Mucilaginibacter flavidus]|uniref:class I SAM-dependent methyltransferase n=1 Tax=Mucilaginibacter flavidus TaxID=2949309 RepID=UPI0020925C10|nr:class I SAM-dependent methyltransferase [Mucilaginibacter flavidus]MCO5947660.1 class I SAM-dependent methyltransferase [Mucilaginibacter flavidus]
MNILKRAINKIKRTVHVSPSKFDATGERVDIIYSSKVDFHSLDMYQKSHYKRYEFATSIVKPGDICGDFACGTGYGSIMLARVAQYVIGADINEIVIKAIKKRYRTTKKVQFINADLLNLCYDNYFDKVISFETIEHFTEENIIKLLRIFNKSLKPCGNLIISTPYLQEKDEAAIKLGHHLTFYIDEKKIIGWLRDTGFELLSFRYQNYGTHFIDSALEKKDFIICVAQKVNKI